MQSSGIFSEATGTVQRPSPSPSTPTRKRFALTGRSQRFDPRINAARGDLADLRLADRLFAPHYSVAVLRSVGKRVALADTVGGDALSEVLVGEPFEVLEMSGGQAWGVSPVDGVVGFLPLEALAPFAATSHVVCAPRDGMLPTGSRVSADRADEATTRPLDAPVADFVSVAESLIGTGRAAGGRSGAGLDAAGLLFLSLELAGIRAPRFVDLQAASLGHAINQEAPMLRGDLIFFADHAAIAVDGDRLVHVGPDGVAIEPLSALVDGHGPVLQRRRLP